MKNIITIVIIIICLFVAICIKGVTVTNESKGIVNKHMSWIEFFELEKQWREGKEE